MREHRYSVEMPHSPERLWALFQDYDNWTQYAPMVIAVEVVHPGDADGNGLLRRVIYKMPLGRRGSALELVTDVVAAKGYTFTMLSFTTRAGPDRRRPPRAHRPEPHPVLVRGAVQPREAPWRWFEGPIYRFINKQNEASMRRASEWLTAASRVPARSRRRRRLGVTTMHAAVLKGKAQIEVDDVPVPAVEAGDGAARGQPLRRVRVRPPHGDARLGPARVRSVATSGAARSSRSATALTGWSVGDHAWADRTSAAARASRAGPVGRRCASPATRRAPTTTRARSPSTCGPTRHRWCACRQACRCGTRRWPNRSPSRCTAITLSGIAPGQRAHRARRRTDRRARRSPRCGPWASTT